MMNNYDEINPPKLAQKLLRWFCSETFIEAVEGDLEEEFYDNVTEIGLRRARFIYIKTVILSFRLYQIKKPSSQIFIQFAMLLNYFKIGYRNLLKHKTYTIINIVGLSFGICCFLLISLYIKDELSFDHLHTNSDRIVRVIDNVKDQTGEKFYASAGYQVSEQAKSQIAGVEDAVKLLGIGRTLITNPDNEYKLYIDMIYSDQAFFSIFDFPLIAGDINTCLKDPNSLIISEKIALQLFGSTDVLGKAIVSGRMKDHLVVSGVFKTFPLNSHIQLDALFSEVSLLESERYRNAVSNDWDSHDFAAYLLLNKEANKGDIEAQINELASANSPDLKDKRKIVLQALEDIHFESAHIENDYNFNKNDITYVYVLGLAGMIILMIACFNYMNLSTARSVARGKEIGIRKVAGAHKISIVLQFLCESFLITFACLAIALITVWIVLPYFNQFTNKNLALHLFNNLYTLPSLLGLVFFISIISGLYPAFILSKLEITNTLKASGKNLQKGMNLRRILVVFQFIVSITLTIATIVAYAQMQFINQKDLGFKKDMMLVADINSGTLRANFQTLKNELLNMSGVSNVSVSSRVPGEWKLIPKTLAKNQGENDEQGSECFFISADQDFLETFEIKLTDGKNFGKSAITDSLAILINETAANFLGIEKAEGQKIELVYANYNGNIQRLEKPMLVEVLGIVEDFHFRSLHEKISPIIIGYRNNPIHSIDYFTLKIAGQNTNDILDSYEDALHKIDPNHIFEYHFLDDQLALFYQNDQRRTYIFSGSAMVAILIAALGLIVLISFSTKQKQKEIGIRKIHGANIFKIMYLLTREFLVLIFLSFLLATPIAWLLMNEWLSIFAYKITLSPFYFLMTACFILILTTASIGIQTIKAASENPINIIRNE